MTVRIEIQVPDPAIVAGAILNKSRLDYPTSVLSPPQPGEAIMGVARLDEARLGPLDRELIWIDLARWASHVTTSTGNRSDHPTMPPEPGAATITLLGFDGLEELGIRPGTPIRITPTATPTKPAWAGWVSTWITTWDIKTDTTVTTLEAVDLAARLGAVTRYGAQHTGTETVVQRWNRLKSSAPVAITYDGAIYTASKLTPTVHETSLLDHLVMAATSCQLVTYTDTITNVVSGWNWFTWSPDSETYSDTLETRSYLDIAIASPLPTTVLEATTHQIGPDGSALDTTSTIIEHLGYAARGHQSASLDYSADPAEAQAIGDWCLRPYDSTPAPTSITLRGTDAYSAYRGRYQRPGDHLWIIRSGRKHGALIAAVGNTWTINPDAIGTPDAIRHTVTYTLVRTPNA